MEDNNKKGPQDTNEDKDYPGYPHYPAKEDITRSDNNNGKLNISNDADSDSADDTRADDIVMGTEADVTQEDLRILNGDSPTAELDNTDDDGTPLNEKIDDTVSPGASLDVPGSELDDANEDIGEEDEENNYYSLGGDKD